MEGGAADGIEAAHVPDQALPHALLVRDGVVAKLERIVLAGLPLRRRWLRPSRHREENKREGNQRKLGH
jgi:hypothetical protein